MSLAALSSLSPLRVYQCLALSRCPSLYELLLSSFAPSVYGHEEVKRGLMSLLVGGAYFDQRHQGGGERETKEKVTRGDIHVLLCGDPGEL